MFAGKLLGGLLGLLAGGLFGAILGVVIGHFFDKSFSGALGFDATADLAARQRVFFESSFRLMGALAKSDGRISEEEIAQAEELMRVLGLAPEHRQEAIALFKEGSQPDFAIEPEMARFIAKCRRHANLTRLLLEFLVSIALADGELHTNEKDMLQRVAHYLGISQAQFERLLSMLQAQQQFGGSHQGSYGGGQTSASDLQKAYQALGVTAEASDQEIKRKYRKLMSEHHPDKLMSQGLPEDMLKVATEKAQEIQTAYDLIKKSRK